MPSILISPHVYGFSTVFKWYLYYSEGHAVPVMVSMSSLVNWGMIFCEACVWSYVSYLLVKLGAYLLENFYSRVYWYILIIFCQTDCCNYLVSIDTGSMLTAYIQRNRRKNEKNCDILWIFPMVYFISHWQKWQKWKCPMPVM